MSDEDLEYEHGAVGENDLMVLVVGESTTGKTSSLMGIRDPERVLYINSEANKRTPFRHKFHEEKITDPYDIGDLVEQGEEADNCELVILDSLTFFLEQFETIYIHDAEDSRGEWGNFQQMFKAFMQQTVAESGMGFVFTAHTHTSVDGNGRKSTCVPVKGALKNNGIESYFSCIVATKKVAVKDLEKHIKEYGESPLLTITKREKRLGYKHVIQTDIDENTTHERLRSPIGMWDDNELFIDGNVQIVLDRLHEFYNS